jgi:hypothetical protein
VLAFPFSFLTISYSAFNVHKHLTLLPEQVKAGHEVWVQANTSSNARKQAKRQALEMKQRSEEVNIDADLTDVHKQFKEKGQGLHLLEMDFEPVTDGGVENPSARTGKPTVFWIWRHKLTEVEVWRYKTTSGKSWDTGMLSCYLQSLTKPKNMCSYFCIDLTINFLLLAGKVHATMFCAEAHCAMVCLQGTHAIRFFQLLE